MIVKIHNDLVSSGSRSFQMDCQLGFWTCWSRSFPYWSRASNNYDHKKSYQTIFSVHSHRQHPLQSWNFILPQWGEWEATMLNGGVTLTKVIENQSSFPTLTKWPKCNEPYRPSSWWPLTRWRTSLTASGRRRTADLQTRTRRSSSRNNDHSSGVSVSTKIVNWKLCRWLCIRWSLLENLGKTRWLASKL